MSAAFLTESEQIADSGATDARAKDVEPPSQIGQFCLFASNSDSRDARWPVALEKPYVPVLDMWFDDAHGTRPDPPSEGASR
ncbi:MAG: hypothetical protein ABSA02_39170 [Trebonia sp.]|jgi:hypothetical protein